MVKRIKYGRISFAHLLSAALVFAAIVLLPTANVDAKRPMKIALLPILDSLPFYVAEAKQYFRDQDVRIKAVPVASALERDQLMQSGEVDAMLNDLMATANFNRRKIQVKSLMSARQAYPDFPLFRLLAAPGSNLNVPTDLAGVPIGISKNTIIEYLTDRLLTANGLLPGQIKKQSVPVIPERYQLLLLGKIKAATLPDPLAKSAIEAGAMPMVDDAAFPHFSVSVLTFSVDAIRHNAASVRGFITAWDRAAGQINQKPERFRDLLLKKIRVPENIRRSYAIPKYPRRAIPDREQWVDVMDWMVAKGLLQSALPYDDSVSSAFLPHK